MVTVCLINHDNTLAGSGKLLCDTKFWREKILVKQFTPKIDGSCFGECPNFAKTRKTKIMCQSFTG